MKLEQLCEKVKSLNSSTKFLESSTKEKEDLIWASSEKFLKCEKELAYSLSIVGELLIFHYVDDKPLPIHFSHVFHYCVEYKHLRPHYGKLNSHHCMRVDVSSYSPYSPSRGALWS